MGKTADTAAQDSTPPAAGTDSGPDAGAESPEQAPLSFWQMLGSAAAAAFGVQSSKNRKRDFSRGKASHFILMGVGFTALFVLLMVGLVNLVLSLT